MVTSQMSRDELVKRVEAAGWSWDDYPWSMADQFGEYRSWPDRDNGVELHAFIPNERSPEPAAYWEE